MKLLLVFVLVLALPFVAGENVSVVGNVNVTVQCVGGTCVASSGSMVVIFQGNDSVTNLTVPWGYSYMENITIVQNVTFLQNVTNLTVTTTNVTVVNCNDSTDVTVSVNDTDLYERIRETVSGTCREACDVSSDERSSLESRARQAEADLQVVQESCQSKINVTYAEMGAALNISRQETVSARNRNASWIVLTGILVLILGTYLWINIRNSRPPKLATGPVTMPDVSPRSGPPGVY